jgi:glycosyltransferase involved in cell wall biosynthesis
MDAAADRPADTQATAPKPVPAHVVSRQAIDGARRRSGHSPAAPDAPWTACAAPSRMLVLAADGTHRACEHACRPLALDTGATWAEAWRGGDATTLRADLAAGRLPLDHCRGCAAWATAGLLTQAPVVAEHGALPAAPAGDEPETLVLRLPADGAVVPGAEGDLRDLLPKLAALAVRCPNEFDVRASQSWLTAVRELAPNLPITLRVGRLEDADALVAACAGLRLVALELDARSAAKAPLASLRVAAERLQSKPVVRFVLRPDTWFHFEDAAIQAAAHTLPLHWHLLDDDGDVPLAQLDAESLTAVKNVVTNSWKRLSGTHRPTAVGEHAFFSLADELRRLLQRRLEAALHQPEPSDAPAALPLPPLDHPWFTDPARRTWWQTTLLGISHQPGFATWFGEHLASGAMLAAMRSQPLLRLLCQRLAYDLRLPRCLEALAILYRAPKERALRGTEDTALAASLDLATFGGPWAQRLGLDPTTAAPRKRPFGIGKAKTPKAGAVPDVTVLIPSYQHGAYIQETIRSVLAQRHTNFRLLVVDDGSPDDTVARAREIVDPRLEVRVNERNLGLGNSVLAALQTIDTPYVALLNSDDMFHPDRLTRCCKALDSTPSAQLVTTGLHLVDQAGGELVPQNVSFVLDGHQVFDWVHWFARATPSEPLHGDQLFTALLERNFLATSSNLVARTEWLRGHAEALQSLKYCLDWQIFLDAAQEGSLCHLPEPLVGYRLHATNTVWFRGGRRWSFYLEVNRVIARALARHIAPIADVEARFTRLLQIVTDYVLPNREADGVALFVNSLVDALQADQVAEASPAIQQQLQRLNQAATAVLKLRDDAAQTLPANYLAETKARHALGDLARELLHQEHDRAERLQLYVDSLEDRLRDVWAGRGRLEQEKQALQQRQRELDQALQGARHELVQAGQQLRALQEQKQQELRAAQEQKQQELRAAQEQKQQELRAAQDQKQQELRALQEQKQLELRKLQLEHDTLAQRLELAGEREQAARSLANDHQQRAEVLARDLAAVRTDLQHATAQAAVLAEVRDLVQQELRSLRTERDELVRHAAQQAQATAAEARRLTELAGGLSAELERDRATLLATRQELALASAARDDARHHLKAARDQIERWRAEYGSLTNQAAELRRNLERETAQVRAQQDAINLLEQRRNELLEAQNRAAEELAKLRQSREYRIGNFIWNKLPLSYMSRRGKKWYHRVLDTKDRFSLWFGNKFGKHKAEGVAVVASCWHWPIYSHTFVYQEMIGLTHMGLDVKMFHWAENDTTQLQPAFGYLADHRTMIKPVWENHKKDKEHFETTKPGRLRALLERVATATGKTMEELEKEPHVLRACTFARMVELSGARYLHTYFFYDQTFMAMVAAWLLEIPRGISCYADHMLDDFPFKLVGLQIELASVIVATSSRIKQELSEKSGGKFDDRIIVKPNGVDGARFPPAERPARVPQDLFEVTSVSRIEPKKGLIHLVEAVAELKRRGHRVRANVIGAHDPHNKGSLEYQQLLERTIVELGLQDDVIMHGMKMQEEILPMLQRSHAFVAPYVELSSGDKDGIPTAMLEAMACSLPVVTTDAGSILEVVDHQVEGFVVAQRDSAAFAKALERLITEPTLERKLSRAARARFDRQFDIKVTERRFHARVAELLAANKAVAAS